jgi:hypothetical protein
MRTRKTKAIEYESCIVTFIDVLGFRALVTNRSAADVHHVIKALERFTKPDNVGVSRKDVRIFSQAHAQSVSDAIVRVRPYKTMYRDGALVHEILDLLHAQIELVNLGVLIRAGLTVGDAYLPASGDGPVFGPAMVRAYEIESQEAVYPRIVIDDDALEQHKLDPLLRSESNSLAEEQKLLRQLLAVGDDGTRYINYLNAVGEFDDPSVHLSFLQTHAQLVRTGRIESVNRNVRRKYEWLTVYHNKQVEGMRRAILSSPSRMRAFYEEYDVDAKNFLDEVTI